MLFFDALALGLHAHCFRLSSKRALAVEVLGSSMGIGGEICRPSVVKNVAPYTKTKHP